MITLPIDLQLGDILQQLKAHRNLVLSAAPGAGKTTRLPPRLLELTEKKVLVLEPRRIAAVGAAQRIAEEQGWSLGKEVGYQIRFDSKVANDTRLIFLTEALLGRKLIADPLLQDVGIVVLDEFHERSQHVDLALGLLKELQELERPDLQVVVMSATLMAEPIANFLGDCAQVQVPGQSYPLDIDHINTAQKLRTDSSFIDLVSLNAKNLSASLKAGEHLLVFLPGVGEINRVFDALTPWTQERDTLLMKLHGTLSLEEQKEVLKPSVQKKIILATNVAESSITVDGVRAVLDSGLQRRTALNPKTGFPSLDLVRISRSSATQRSGRAARQAPGKCLRLWSSMDELSMQEQETAEILRVDLSEALLFLASSGVRDFPKFSWFEAPPRDGLSRAEKNLRFLGALTPLNEITALGKKLAQHPLPPRLGKLLEVSIELGDSTLGADLAALLLERDIANSGSVGTHLECDLMARLELFRSQRQRFSMVERASQQLRSRVRSPSGHDRDFSPDLARKILLRTFTDQLCRRRKSGEPRGLMISGRGVTLDPGTQVRQSPFFIALNVTEGLSQSETKVAMACGVTEDLIRQQFPSQIHNRTWIEFDEDTEKVLKKDCRSLILPGIGNLTIENERTSPASAQDATEHLPQIAIGAKESILKKNEALGRWLERFHVYSRYFPEKTELPEQFWDEVLTEASFGETSLSALYSKDIIYFVESKLPKETINHFHRSAPEHFVVPSGSRIRVNYAGAHPTLEVRLQEIFGWLATPPIMDGKALLTLTLLAPNFRPVQVTQDLASFWDHGYNEVKKELKARYPKHSWPENPRSAIPQAKGRPRPT